MKTIDYYNKHAEEFTASTFEVDMESLYQLFLALLPESVYILDLGCGPGRDSLAFKNKGYHVDTIDYLEELVKKATRLTGIPIKLQSFYEIDADEAYDGIWACASLLHCERSRFFAGSLRSGQRAANIMTLIQSAKLNGLDPYAYLSDVLKRLPTHKVTQIEDLLPHAGNLN